MLSSWQLLKNINRIYNLPSHPLKWSSVDELSLLPYSCRSVSYVKQMKMLQNLKEKSLLSEEHYKKGEFILYNKSRPLLSEKFQVIWTQYSDLKLDFKVLLDSSVLVGLSDNLQPQFAVQLGHLNESFKEQLENVHNGQFCDLRLTLMILSGKEAEKVSKGNAMLNWHRTNKFCSSCGSITEKNYAGSLRACTQCKRVHYPTVSPVGITLVADMLKTKLLLVRQSRHPRGMYTCIAGYVDTGETIEESIKREVAEEVGLAVQTVDYKASQHWPFPTSNLMVGCHAFVNGDEELDIDKVELQDAKWFPVEEVKKALEIVKANPMQTVFATEEGQFFVPPPGTVAHVLIDTWLQKYSVGDLY